MLVWMAWVRVVAGVFFLLLGTALVSGVRLPGPDRLWRPYNDRRPEARAATRLAGLSFLLIAIAFIGSAGIELAGLKDDRVEVPAGVLFLGCVIGSGVLLVLSARRRKRIDSA